MTALALASTGFSQIVDVSKEPRLQKAISIKLKIVSLPVALKELSKMSGVHLENVPTISDLKVTAFVKDLPLGILMDKIAGVLGCQWKADGDLYRIGLDNEERLWRERYVNAEDAVAKKEVEDQLNEIAELSSIDPAMATKEYADQLLVKNGEKRGNVTFDPKRMEFLKKAMTFREGVLGRFLTNLDATKTAAFWRGEVLVGVGAPAAPAASAGTNAGAADDAAQIRQRRRAPVSTPIFVQYDPLLFQVRVAQRGAVRTVTTRPARIVTQFVPTGELAKLPFGKEVLAWDEPVPTDGDFTKISVISDATQSSYFDKRTSVADFLEKAFEQTHVPFVADGFRTTTVNRNFNRGLGTLSAWLSILKQEEHLFTRVEDGVIEVRHGGFWRLRKFEAPEEALAGIETKAEKGKDTLDDYATMLAKLTPEQVKPFTIPNGAVAKFDTRPIESAYPALLFYASLDSRSIAKAMQDGIVYDQFRSNQRQLFVDAALEGVFLGASSVSFGEALLRLSSTGDARGLGFIMRKGTVDQRGIAVDGQAMLFGASMTESSTYRIGVAE